MKYILGSFAIALGIIVLLVLTGIFPNPPAGDTDSTKSSSDASSVSFGDEGYLNPGNLWDSSVTKLPVARSQEDLVEMLKVMQAKDLLSLSQMMDGNRFKMYPIGSKVRVTSVRGHATRVEMMDGSDGWVLDEMIIR